MNQGDLYWCDFPGPIGRRPGVILTRRSALELLTAITMAPVTTRIRHAPSQVIVGEAEGLDRVSAINLDGIITIRATALGEYIGRLSRTGRREVRAAIEFALGFRELSR